MYTAFFESNWINPLVGTSLAIFAKSSMLWSPILFIFSNKTIIQKLKDSKEFGTKAKNANKIELTSTRNSQPFSSKITANSENVASGVSDQGPKEKEKSQN